MWWASSEGYIFLIYRAASREEAEEKLRAWLKVHYLDSFVELVMQTVVISPLYTQDDVIQLR